MGKMGCFGDSRRKVRVLHTRPMTKICPTCGAVFEKDFAAQRYCKPCKRAYDKVYYDKTQERRTSQKRLTEAARGLQYKAKVYSYLLEHPCVDCGESDSMVLEFDHVRGEKLFNVGESYRRYGWAKIQEEMDKCEVRCSNCHTKVTKYRDKKEYKPEIGVDFYDPLGLTGFPDGIIPERHILWLK